MLDVREPAVIMIKRLFLTLLLAVPLAAGAGTCKVVGKTCLDAVEPKTVSGMPVFFASVGITDACWQWENTYDCVDTSTAVDHCAAIDQTAGCGTTSSTCTQVSIVDGSCDIYTKNYRCGNPVTGVTNVVVLDGTYTVVQDDTDYSACYAQNASCNLSGSVCTDGPSTKVVFPGGGSRLATPTEVTNGTSPDGAVVYKDCWSSDYTYSCMAGNYANYCQPLVTAGCTESSSPVCKNTGWDGSCLEYERTYNCGTKVEPPPANVTFLNSSYSIVSDTTTTTCSDPASSPNCVEAGRVCTDGPATKVILADSSTRLATPAEEASGISADGSVVTKACWAYDFTYTCATSTLTSNCAALQADANCLEKSASCIDYLNDGVTCAAYQHIYSCNTSGSGTKTVTDCGTQQYCSDGNCFDSGYTPDSDLALVVAGKEALYEAGAVDVFKGVPGKCTDGNWGLAHCCKVYSGGEGASNYSVTSQMASSGLMTGLNYAGETIRQVGSQYLYNALFSAGQYGDLAAALASVAGTEIVDSAEAALLQNATTSPVVSIGAYGLTWASGATSGFMGGNILLAGTVPGAGGAAATTGVISSQGVMGGYLYFNPYTFIIAIVIMVVMEMMTCSDDESMKLGIKRGQGLCHMVGSYCSSKSLGTCKSTSEGWCCFPSKLGRIINEQGRPQIGKGWGSAETPDCSGFTLEQLKQLKFDQMDLSEFISTVKTNVTTKSSTYAVTRAQSNALSGTNSSYYSITPTPVATP
jgi:conjugal transfer mating pair stabilization protein TraN